MNRNIVLGSIIEMLVTFNDAELSHVRSMLQFYTVERDSVTLSPRYPGIGETKDELIDKLRTFDRETDAGSSGEFKGVSAIQIVKKYEKWLANSK